MWIMIFRKTNGETTDQFVTGLHKLAAHREFHD